jgi:hypothetical protein
MAAMLYVSRVVIARNAIVVRQRAGCVHRVSYVNDLRTCSYFFMKIGDETLEPACPNAKECERPNETPPRPQPVNANTAQSELHTKTLAVREILGKKLRFGPERSMDLCPTTETAYALVRRA